MLLTIVAIWAIVIPVAVLGLSLRLAKAREMGGLPTAARSASEHRSGTSGAAVVPRCAVPRTRPRRTTMRRVCPEQPRGVRRRPASA
jgi:hypothetical protein